MQNDNKISISLTTIIIIAICIGALILGIICYFIFGNKSSNNEAKLDTTSLNSSSQTNNPVSNSDSNLNTRTNENSSANMNTPNTQNNNTYSSTNVSTSNAKTSSKTNPLSVGEWGIASKYASGEYVDVLTRVTNITRGAQAAQEFKNYCERGSSIYKYEDAKESMEWAIVEYEVDLTGFSSNTSVSLDRKISGTGDNNSIKYNNMTYIVSTVNMTSDYTSGKVVTAKFATQLPIGCSEYIIAPGSSSNTQAFYYGKIKNKTV